MVETSGLIGHFAVDIAPLSDFYQILFGWTSKPRGSGYVQVSTPTLRGALVEAPEASLTLGIVVADLDEALGQAASVGGTVVMSATDNGWVRKGQVRDPAGNLLTLIQK